MACFSPMKGYRKPGGGVTFRRSESSGSFLNVKCGMCIGCRADRRDDWVTRLYHEAQTSETSVFFTLTYDSDNLPMGGTLAKKDFQLFMKRLRKRIEPLKIRFFAVGEYGDKTKRPHYHGIIFGFDFPDRGITGSRKGNPVFRSDLLESCWRFGSSELSVCSVGVIKYVAGYHMKKFIGDRSSEYYLERYQRVDYRTGEIYEVEPEFQLCSTRPGIGHDWYRKFGKSDALANGFCVLDGTRRPIPRYYLYLLEKDDPELYERLMEEKSTEMERFADDYTDDRLDVRAEVLRRNTNILRSGSL